MLRKFCAIQREKYGPDWKRILAKEMTDQSMPVLKMLLNLKRTSQK